MQFIEKYFPDLTCLQNQQLAKLPALYQEWNKKINVISRSDLQNLEERHVLHSLAICKQVIFRERSRILDLGTGGGFPGIPLAIYFPNCNFHLVDGIKKKITVVEAVAKELSLTNVIAEQKRAEDLKELYDFIVIRAVADSIQLWKYCKHLLTPDGILVCLKGGDIQKELLKLPKGLISDVTPISSFYTEEFFQEKYIVTIRNAKV